MKNIFNVYVIYLVRVDIKLLFLLSGYIKNSNSNNNNNNKEIIFKIIIIKSSRDEGKKYLCILDLFVKVCIVIKWI